MSLRLKTILGVALIEAMLLLLLVVVVLNYLRSTNDDALIKRAETVVTLFATTTEDAVLTFDLASLESYAETLLENPDLVYARIYGPDDFLFTETGDTTHLDQGFAADDSIDSVTDGVFDAQAFIREGETVYGKVQIGIDIDSIESVIAEAESRSILIALIEMVLVALFSYLLGTYLVSQLTDLRRAARRISRGNYDIQLPERGKDEIAQVSRGFNAMVTSLREASHQRDLYEMALEKLNRDLEARVEERTLELSIKNSELERANEEIQEAQDSVLRSAKMASLGQMAAGVAHEINNPLAYTMSNLQSLGEYTQSYRRIISDYEALLAEGNDQQKSKVTELRAQYDLDFLNEDLDDLLKDSTEGMQRVREIVKGLREFSHTDTEAEFEAYDLNECVQTSLKMANNELKYHCDIDTQLGALPKVMCNPGQINQVMVNLLVNAGQAIEGRGTITVQSRAVDSWVEVSIRDTGKGMTDEQQSKVFDPFFTTKPVGQGTGLGLAICYGIIQDHGGEINLVSEIGTGSEFVIRLPVANETADRGLQGS